MAAMPSYKQFWHAAISLLMVFVRHHQKQEREAILGTLSLEPMTEEVVWWCWDVMDEIGSL